MPKNIILCCDGTNNQFSGDQTNVIRTHKVARRSAGQVTYYQCGVGTMPEPWREGPISRSLSLVGGLAFGDGFEENVADAYRFLMSNYETGDKVFLFGFSRGAYTARAVAAMLHSVGLLHPGSENLIRYAESYWQKDFGPKSPGEEVCLDFKRTLARDCPIHFIGVWDTVGSVGFINKFNTFPYTFKNPSVTYVRHAVAIDERRSCFRQNLMLQAYANQDIKNVWFAGVHSDVGGGYPPNEAGLAKIAFEWMMKQARLCDLKIDETALEFELRGHGAAPDACARQHDSLRCGWKLVEWIPVRRYNWATGEHEWRLPLSQPRDVEWFAAKPEVFMHQSVIARLKGLNDYRPPNIPHTEAELKAKFRIEPY